MDNLTFSKVLYKDILNEPGVYLIEVKGGKKYIGQSKFLKKRIQAHIREIFKEGTGKQNFHKMVHEIVKKQGYTKENINELFTFWVCPTITDKEAEDKEAWYLEQINFLGKKKEYYNIWFASQEALNNKKIESFKNKIEKEKKNTIFSKVKNITF